MNFNASSFAYGRSLLSLKGSLIKLQKYHFVFLPDIQTIIVKIDKMEHVGADDSPPHGNPRYAMAVPVVQNALARGITGCFEGSLLSESLEPEELLAFMQNDSEVTRGGIERKVFPAYFCWNDCVIDEEQQGILEKVSIGKHVSPAKALPRTSPKKSILEKALQPPSPRKRVRAFKIEECIDYASW